MSADETRVAQSRTRVTKLVFPQDTNPLATLYGGTALQWMDEVAFLTATRYARCQVVTVSMDRVDFKVPIPQGSIVELLGDVVKVGRTSMTVRVRILLEDAMAGTQLLAIEGHLVMVAVDESMKPVAL
jgi:acyl-CoA hydrolase